MSRFGGPVVSSALSRKTNFSSLNSMSRIREGRTCRFHCNLYICNLKYIKCQDLVVHAVFSTCSALSRKTNFSSLTSMSRIREGPTCRFHCNLYICNLKYTKCQDLVVQFSVVFWVGQPILVVWTVCPVSEKVARGCFIIICTYM